LNPCTNWKIIPLVNLVDQSVVVRCGNPTKEARRKKQKSIERKREHRDSKEQHRTEHPASELWEPAATQKRRANVCASSVGFIPCSEAYVEMR